MQEELEKLKAENERLKIQLYDSFQGHLLKVVIPKLENDIKHLKDKLKEYEDKIEEGLLIELPFLEKQMYRIDTFHFCKLSQTAEYCDIYYDNNRTCKKCDFYSTKFKIRPYILKWDFQKQLNKFYDALNKKEIFNTKEKTEQAIKELEAKNNG